MAAYAALVSLLNNIHTITNHPSLSTSLENKHIQPLLEKTNFLLDFMEGNNYAAGSKEGQDLERQIASAAHAAEDLIESHIVDQIHAAKGPIEPNIWPYLLIFLLKCVGCHLSDRSEVMEQLQTHLAGPLTGRSEEPLDLQHTIEDMDAIIKEANQYKEKRRLREEHQPTHAAEPLRDGGESGMVGLDAELNQLLDELTGYQSSLCIISIVGMGGAGKTTLAKNVYENKLIKDHFHIRAWATISQQVNTKEILSKLLSGLGIEELSSATVDDLGLQLHKTLYGIRYLIVLDDIWSVTAWDEVKRFFPDKNNASRILLTTRLSNVARDCGSSLLTMNLLDEENSWKLFCKKVFQNDVCPLELQEVSEEIVKLCKGLALSIVVLGGLLLKSPRNLEYWKGVAKNLKSIPNSKEKQDSIDVLTLSYNHLPSHLKPCFLYMGVFKEDFEIPISKIIKLWIAEGFIKPVGSQVLEEIADGFIKDLIDRNLIIGGRRRKNGKFGYFGIHDLLRDLCVKLAEQEGFLLVTKDVVPGTQRRLVDNWYINRTDLRLPLVRTIMTHNSIKQPIEFRLLRILDQDGFYSKLDFCSNVNLRYVSYINVPHGNFSWEFPTSISLLWSLQTIIINNDPHCLIVAPTEFWKIPQLRHVECFKIYLPCPPSTNEQDELLILENLQTLKRTVDLRLSEEVCRIIPNINNLHLSYDDSLQGFEDSWMECLLNLDRLHNLESLNLKRAISNPVLVRNLKTNCITSLPNSLKKLSLSHSGFHWDDLTMIGLLPQLEVLNFGVAACVGGQWSPVDAQFRRLKFLRIEECDLVCWDADESSFPVLEKLILKGLNDLREIPLSLGDIPTLELIRVDICSVSAAISAVKIKEDQLELNDGLQVQVKVRGEKQQKSFNQMLETEGLTIDNIQLEN